LDAGSFGVDRALEAKVEVEGVEVEGVEDASDGVVSGILSQKHGEH
jgi:hypothetical protein